MSALAFEFGNDSIEQLFRRGHMLLLPLECLDEDEFGGMSIASSSHLFINFLRHGLAFGLLTTHLKKVL